MEFLRAQAGFPARIPVSAGNRSARRPEEPGGHSLFGHGAQHTPLGRLPPRSPPPGRDTSAREHRAALSCVQGPGRPWTSWRHQQAGAHGRGQQCVCGPGHTSRTSTGVRAGVGVGWADVGTTRTRQQSAPGGEWHSACHLPPGTSRGPNYVGGARAPSCAPGALGMNGVAPRSQ